MTARPWGIDWGGWGGGTLPRSTSYRAEQLERERRSRETFRAERAERAMWRALDHGRGEARFDAAPHLSTASPAAVHRLRLRTLGVEDVLQGGMLAGAECIVCQVAIARIPDVQGEGLMGI